MKQNSTHFLLMIPLALFLTTGFSAHAQINYQVGGFSTSAGTYTDLGTNGTAISVANNDDAFSAPQPIGFTFNFNGYPYDSFTLSTNGFIKLGSDTASSHLLFTTYVQPPAGGPFNSTNPRDTSLVVPFGNDLWGGPATPEFRVYTSGVPGTQVCTIQWKNLRDKLQNAVDPQYDTINFQLKLYEGTNMIEFVYGRWVASASPSNARFAACGIKGNTSVTAQLLTMTKASSTAWSVAAPNSQSAGSPLGNYTTNALNYGNNVGVGRPAPDIGRVYRFTPLVLNDVAVTTVYAMGKVPLGAYPPDSIRAWISNPGLNAQSNIAVTLDITGVNNHNTTIIIPSLPANSSRSVSFAPYTPGLTGNSLITVSVPPDDNNTNNQATYGFAVTDNNFAYTDTTQPAAQSYGGTTPVIWATKYTVSGTRMITKVRSLVLSNSASTGDTVCGVVTDLAGNILGRSPGHIIQPSDLGTYLTFNISIPPVITNSAFMAGIACGYTVVPATNYFMGTVQNETPIRPNNDAFWQMNGTIGITTLATGNFFATPFVFSTARLMMECTAEPLPPNDAGVFLAKPVSNFTVPINRNIPLHAYVKNLGSAAQTPGIPVRYRINNGVVSAAVMTNASINPGDTTSVVFSNALNFASAGAYTVKIFTQLPGDVLAYNDTLTIIINAVAPSALVLPYRLANNIIGTWTPSGNLNLFKQGTFIQANGQSNANVLFADNTAATGEAFLHSPLLDFTGLTNPVMHFHVAHAPSTGIARDSLEIMVSTDYGLTFSPVYTKAGQGSSPTLGTVAAQATTYSPAAGSDWRHEVADLSAYANTPDLIIAIRAVSNSGNRVYIGNIVISNPVAHMNTPVFGTGFYGNGILSIIYNSIGAASGMLSISSYGASPFSSASPVYNTNSTATTNGSNIFTPDNVSNRYWTTTYNGIGTGNLPATVSYDVQIDYSSLAGILDPDKLYIMKRSENNGAWTTLSTTRSGTSLIAGPITGFSDFAIGSQFSQNPLPVYFIMADVKKKSKNVSVTWSTANEINNDHFEIERMTDKSFIKIGEVKSAGNSTLPQYYQFIDETPVPAACYRIRQIDRNREQTLSNIACLKSTTANARVVYPNPFTDKIEITSASALPRTIRIIDMQGKEIFSTTYTDPGNIIITEVKNLREGIYFVEVSDGDKTETIKIFKLK